MPTENALTELALLGALRGEEGELGQVLALLRAAGSREPESLSLGDGDRRLLALHQALTGHAVEVTVTCPGCETVSAGELLPELLPARKAQTVRLAGGGLRAPTYADLLGLPDESSEAEAEIVRRCSVGAHLRAPTPDDLELVDDSLCGPLVLTCVGCGEAVEAPVDVERLVLELLVRRLAEVELEVHLLASAYHWTLETIESLSDERRRTFAGLVAESR